MKSKMIDHTRTREYRNFVNASREHKKFTNKVSKADRERKIEEAKVYYFDTELKIFLEEHDSKWKERWSHKTLKRAGESIFYEEWGEYELIASFMQKHVFQITLSGPHESIDGFDYQATGVIRRDGYKTFDSMHGAFKHMLEKYDHPKAYLWHDGKFLEPRLSFAHELELI